MKRGDNKFYYFLSFITFYSILLIWYQLYMMEYEDSFYLSAQAYYSPSSLGPYRYTVFIFEVVLSFPFGVVSWVNQQPLNLVYYFIGCLFYTLFFYRVFHQKLAGLLWVMVLLNVLAVIFLFAFAVDNHLLMPEAEEATNLLLWNKS
ncbi:MAG TPA: hypothetical protein VGE66_00660 [Chitinophagaceae bacterium]